MKNNDIIEQIINESIGNSLIWEAVDPREYERIIFNCQYVFKAYITQVNKKDKSFNLLFIEKKYPDQHFDYDGNCETYFPEIIVFKDNTVIGTFNENNAEKDDLIRLSSIINTNNNNMEMFKSIFDA